MPSASRSHAISPPLKRIVHPSQRSILGLVWQELVGLFFAFLLLLPMWTIIIVFLPISLIAGWCLDIFIFIFMRDSYPGFQRLSPWDFVWLHTSTSTTVAAAAAGAEAKAPPVTTVLVTLEGGISFAELKALVLDRMVLAKDDNNNLMYPRFMQKVIKMAGVFAWVIDQDFDPANHFLLIPDHVNTNDLLRGYVGELAKTELPRALPLWMIHVRTNFGLADDTVIVFRYHQSMSDGISLVKILCRSITDKTDEVYHIKSRFGGINFSINTIRSGIMASVFFITRMLLHPRADCNKLHNPFYENAPASASVASANKVAADKDKVTARKNEIFWAPAVSLNVLDRICMVTRNPLHNVLLSCLSGAMRTCFASDGLQRVTAVRACISVDLRRPLASVTNAIEMGNQFVLLNIRLPTDTIGSVPRLWKIRQEEDNLKNTSNTTSIYWIIQILGRLMPVGMTKNLLSRSIISSCSIANLPGPDAQLFLDKKPLKSLFFWPSPINSKNILTVSFFTYSQKLYMALAADADVCDVKTLAGEFSRQVQDLSELLSNRRAPGEVKRKTSESRDQPITVLRTRILEVQRALVEAQIAASSLSVQKNHQAFSEQAAKVELLKEELMEMLSAVRRRKSVVEGVSMDFEEDEDMLNEVRSGMMSPRRRSSSVSSVESVRVFAVTPTRLSGNVDMRESLAINVARSRTYSNMSEKSHAKALKKNPQAHVIYVTADEESNDSAQTT